jgi:hypothetical protein
LVFVLVFRLPPTSFRPPFYFTFRPKSAGHFPVSFDLFLDFSQSKTSPGKISPFQEYEGTILAFAISYLLFAICQNPVIARP